MDCISEMTSIGSFRQDASTARAGAFNANDSMSGNRLVAPRAWNSPIASTTGRFLTLLGLALRRSALLDRLTLLFGLDLFRGFGLARLQHASLSPAQPSYMRPAEDRVYLFWRQGFGRSSIGG
jgi:hypothetical protein